MAFTREEVHQTVERYHELRRRIDDGLETNAFGALADFYTDDAVYIDAAWGRIEGNEAIAHWLVDSMVGLGDWLFPVEFTAIEGNDVVVKWTQILPVSRSDGTPYTQSGYSRLIYAGDGKFSYEEDTYNMLHVLEDIEAGGWVPTEPMNAPPEHPTGTGRSPAPEPGPCPAGPDQPIPPNPLLPLPLLPLPLLPLPLLPPKPGITEPVPPWELWDCCCSALWDSSVTFVVRFSSPR